MDMLEYQQAWLRISGPLPALVFHPEHLPLLICFLWVLKAALSRNRHTIYRKETVQTRPDMEKHYRVNVIFEGAHA
jgi:hypothetical protein